MSQRAMTLTGERRACTERQLSLAFLVCARSVPTDR